MNINTLDVQKNGVSFKVLSDTKQAWIWSQILANAWEEETFRVFDHFLKPDSAYLDIGAWIGPTALYGACKSKHVYAVEPDDTAFQEFIQNLELNPSLKTKVTGVNAALTAHTGPVLLYTRTEPGDSMSSMIPTLSYDNFAEVRGLTIADFATEYAVKDIRFIKMDVEGGEFSLLPSMHDYLEYFRPTLYVSFHRQYLREEIKLKHSKGEFQSGDHPISLSDLIEKHTSILARIVFESLNFYKFIYDADGRLVNPEQALLANDDGPFVFTDQPW